jgi:hypothetical protein
MNSVFAQDQKGINNTARQGNALKNTDDGRLKRT